MSACCYGQESCSECTPEDFPCEPHAVVECEPCRKDQEEWDAKQDAIEAEMAERWRVKDGPPVIDEDWYRSVIDKHDRLMATAARDGVVELIVQGLDGIDGVDDPETAHGQADDLLLDAAPAEVREAYLRLAKRSSGWWFA